MLRHYGMLLPMLDPKRQHKSSRAVRCGITVGTRPTPFESNVNPGL